MAGKKHKKPKPTSGVAIYARTSSKTNENGAHNPNHTNVHLHLFVTRTRNLHLELQSHSSQTQITNIKCSEAIWQASRPRQIASAKLACVKGERILKTVSEVISGCLPANARSKLQGLLAGKRFLKIYVESSRAIARSAKAT